MKLMPDATPESLRDYGFRLLESDLKFLMGAFADTLRRLGEPALAERLPWAGSSTGEMDVTDRKLGQAYSIAFQLLNIVEERTASRVRRLREKQQGVASEKGLWSDNIKKMSAAGLTQAEMLEMLHHVLVDSVGCAVSTGSTRT